MIVAYFQARQSVNSLGKLEDSNLATFLIGFLYHYGFEYDYYNIFIVAPKKPPKGKERNDMMDSYQYMMNQIHQNPVTKRFFNNV